MTLLLHKGDFAGGVPMTELLPEDAVERKIRDGAKGDDKRGPDHKVNGTEAISEAVDMRFHNSSLSFFLLWQRQFRVVDDVWR
ncbi:hypothetical protein PYH37_001937 [Sinorhizobium numidicum]|uniref:Uncharacterized protein n=1 Tax=Sinorhizobium numidicum TaxID=680248 RepID=A0ABY8CPA6_9HYPH|nr:hypothetical protein [Sinorhizobium numidicum]WEX74503.1 hypothetical protein PYH37_001937 [Sinorhizobium numidicum]WEX80493.1 hypothetical protein PYH38_001939 [Sinorhizobium numidicum]